MPKRVRGAGFAGGIGVMAAPNLSRSVRGRRPGGGGIKVVAVVAVSVDFWIAGAEG